jgi:small subunit ribosomal protein S17
VPALLPQPEPHLLERADNDVPAPRRPLPQSSFLAPQQLAARPARRAAVDTTIRAAQPLYGKVVSTSQSKTAVVEVASLQVHPVYQKRVRITTNYQAHDEQQVAQVGDYVNLKPCRPLSKTKRFVVDSIVKKAQ